MKSSLLEETVISLAPTCRGSISPYAKSLTFTGIALISLCDAEKPVIGEADDLLF